MTSNIDTSGAVGPVNRGLGYEKWPDGYGDRAGSLFVTRTWESLDPLTQGAVEAALRYLNGKAGRFGFRHLAPETLKWFIEECAKARDVWTPWIDRKKAGADFWRTELCNRIRLYLADDGKVRIGGAAI